MLPLEKSNKALMKFFRKRYIADLDNLFNVLETKSRMSVFRRLKRIGYITSYTHAGRYYTLKEIPAFDPWGLWFYNDIGFSQAGTLKDTVTKIVLSSDNGMTPKELLHLLKIGIPNTLHNTLHGLVKSNTLNRHRLESLCLYTSVNPNKEQKQIKNRQEKQKGSQLVEHLSTETIIVILAEALKTSKTIVSPSTIVARLAVRGLTVTVEQVKRIFSQYEIKAEKKTIVLP